MLAGAGRTGEPGSMSKMPRSVIESESELSPRCLRAFSSRSALKSFSRGVSAAIDRKGGEGGGGEDDDDDCEPSVLSASSPSRARRPGEEPRTGTDREKNLGTGSDEGAGEWWKPGPA